MSPADSVKAPCVILLWQ